MVSPWRNHCSSYHPVHPVDSVPLRLSSLWSPCGEGMVEALIIVWTSGCLCVVVCYNTLFYNANFLSFQLTVGDSR